VIPGIGRTIFIHSRDCLVPGCPPGPTGIRYALLDLLNGIIPVLPG
jgi:coenzyme F420-reducing hydrogenase gamma subunit